LAELCYDNRTTTVVFELINHRFVCNQLLPFVLITGNALVEDRIRYQTNLFRASTSRRIPFLMNTLPQAYYSNLTPSRRSNHD